MGVNYRAYWQFVNMLSTMKKTGISLQYVNNKWQARQPNGLLLAIEDTSVRVIKDAAHTYQEILNMEARKQRKLEEERNFAARFFYD